MTDTTHAGPTGYKELATWGSRSTFYYRHANGLHLSYGNGRRLRVHAENLERLVDALRHTGKVLPVFGPETSLDAFARATITKTRIASYLAAVLVDLGLAERSGGGLAMRA